MAIGVKYEFISRDSKFELGYHIDKYTATYPDGTVTSFDRQVPMRPKKKR